VQLGAGGEGGAGEALDGGPALGLLGGVDRLHGAALAQHALDHLGSEGVRHLPRRQGDGRLVPALVDVPAQRPHGARRGREAAVRLPGDPVLAVGEWEERE
jgi:hypothetical protein